MIEFLDEVHNDLNLAVERREFLQRSIQSRSLQVDAFMKEVDLDEKRISHIVNLFKQKKVEWEQAIDTLRRETHDQNEDLTITERKISFYRELKILKGPLNFKEFPSEIRNMILKSVLVQDAPIKFGLYSPRSSQHRKLAVLQTSKQMHSEAAAVFYGENMFTMDGTDLDSFLIIKGAEHVRHLSLHLRSNCSITKTLRAIEKCSILKSLRIYLVSTPRLRGNTKCNVERMRSLSFKKPASLEHINTEVCRSSSGINLDSLCYTLQRILEEGGFEKRLRRSVRNY